MTRRTVALDLETTHLDPFIAEPWEIGLIVREDGAYDGLKARILVPVELRTADARALSINGYFERTRAVRKLSADAADLAPGVYDCTSSVYPGVWSEPSSVALWLSGLLLDAQIVGNNPGYDTRVLTHFFRKWGGVQEPWYHRLVDVRQRAIGYLRGQATAFAMADIPFATPDDLDVMASGDLFKLLGIDPAQYNQHEALPDARLALDVFDKTNGH